MQRIALPDINVKSFSQARRTAVDKASEMLDRPVIVAWKDDTDGRSAPEIPGGRAGRWHDYGENYGGLMELDVGDAYHFIFTEAAGFEEPDINLISLDDGGASFLCLNDACTEEEKQKFGYFSGGGLGG